MRSRHHGNALLVELLIVVLFFMLASTILMQVFAGSRNQSEAARITSEALNCAQNAAERLYHARDAADSALLPLGFAQRDEQAWLLEGDEYSISVSAGRAAYEFGTMYHYTVTAEANGEELFVLPVSVYAEAGQ